MYVQTRNCGSRIKKKLFHVLVNQHALFFSKPAKYLTLKRSLDAARRLLLPAPFLFNYFNHRIYINVLETFSFEASFRAKIICKKRMRHRFRKSLTDPLKRTNVVPLFSNLARIEAHRRTKVLTWLYASPILALSLSHSLSHNYRVVISLSKGENIRCEEGRDMAARRAGKNCPGVWVFQACAATRRPHR